MPNLQLQARDFGDEIICTGPQIASVLEALISMPELGGCNWYAGSIDPTGTNSLPYLKWPHRAPHPSRIDDIPGLLRLLRSTNQLLDGVFIALPAQGALAALPFPVRAEARIGQQVPTSLAELRVFDVSAIEIFGDSAALLERVKQRYGGTFQ